ncbi:type IX secretion system protein PorQ [Aquimarina agarivorans]|uniref:type IX secretion system protein PorQ n=1 Tax=Aquimarina agarivorans TaxID=980584 RepID=UPI000248EA94|nr:type IX secretion system protein PorQ [Aquimarina agarivorans]
MKKSLVVFFFITLCFSAQAQIGGRATYQFLNLESSARQVALGGKIVTDFKKDPTSGLFNPATINRTMNKNYAINYVNYLADINYGSAAAAFRLGRTEKMVHFGVIYANYGKFDGFDLLGNETGEFSAAETAVSFGYAQQIPKTDFYLGSNLKFISSRLEQYTSLGIAADFGILYYKEDTDLNIGLVIRNVGTQITTFADTREKLPLEINAGISQIPKHVPVRWFVTLQNLQFWNLAFSNTNRNTDNLLRGESEVDDPSFLNNVLRHVNLGAELFPRGGFNLRIGYNFRRSEELSIQDQRSFAGISAGFSIKMRKLTFSYGYARYNLAGSSSVFGLNLNLGEY